MLLVLLILCLCTWCKNKATLDQTLPTMFAFARYNPAGPFATFKLQNPSRDVPELHKICRSPDLNASKLRKGRPGSTPKTPITSILLKIPLLNFAVESLPSSDLDRKVFLNPAPYNSSSLKRVGNFLFIKEKEYLDQPSLHSEELYLET